MDAIRIQHSRPAIDKDDIDSAIKVLSSGKLATGDEVRMFLKDVCRYVGLDNCGGVVTNSGTNALYLALRSLGVGNVYGIHLEPRMCDDEVIIPSYVCRSVLSAVEQTGATPVLADIGSHGYNIDPDDCRIRMTKNTKAIIVPHMFGTPAGIDRFIELSQESGVPVIEDCAQSIGAGYDGKKVGSFGNLSIFSFYATKCMTSGGHGGMAVSDSADIIEILNRLTQYDKTKEHSESYNYSLTDLQAVIGRQQLKKLDSFIERRQDIAGIYDEVFNDLEQEIPSSGGIYFRYIIEVECPDHYIREMKNQGIICERPVFKPLHQYLKLDSKNYPNTERAMEYAISIPIYPSMSDAEIDYVCKAIKTVWGK